MSTIETIYNAVLDGNASLQKPAWRPLHGGIPADKILRMV